MNDIFNKLGVYDLIAVLLSGISICTFTLLALHFAYNVQIDLGEHINETLSFLVVSYFVGVIFQELGSIIIKPFTHKNNVLLKKALQCNDNYHTFLTAPERDGAINYVTAKLNIEKDNINIIYNYCKSYVNSNCDTTLIDRDQSLSAMSRSLFLYFVLLALISIISLFDFNWIKVGLVVVSIILSLFLFRRFIRYSKLRYTYIFRAFYYNAVVK